MCEQQSARFSLPTKLQRLDIANFVMAIDDEKGIVTTTNNEKKNRKI